MLMTVAGLTFGEIVVRLHAIAMVIHIMLDHATRAQRQANEGYCSLHILTYTVL